MCAVLDSKMWSAVCWVDIGKRHKVTKGSERERERENALALCECSRKSHEVRQVQGKFSSFIWWPFMSAASMASTVQSVWRLRQSGCNQHSTRNVHIIYIYCSYRSSFLPWLTLTVKQLLWLICQHVCLSTVWALNSFLSKWKKMKGVQNQRGKGVCVCNWF